MSKREPGCAASGGRLGVTGLRFSTRSAVVLGAEVQLDVEFLFEEIGTALGVAQVFGGVTVRFDLKGDGTAVEGRM